MAECTCENWALQDLALALQDMHKGNRKIVVPMFQRGRRWTGKQENKFIDSLVKGYPVGTMLFYESHEGETRTYILVDGLQRGNCIKKYMSNPAMFFYNESISDDDCGKIVRAFKRSANYNYSDIRKVIVDFIQEQKNFKNIQYYPLAKSFIDYFNISEDTIEDVIDALQSIFESKQELYDKVANTRIPIIIYTGNEDTLPEIFDRINSQGTPLDKYEVYAAAWPVKEKYKVENTAIIEHVINKYESLVDDNYFIHNYNRETLRSTKELNAFEYLFGLGKFLVDEYFILEFDKKRLVDQVNPIAFELVNACLNDTDKVKHLYKDLQGQDVNEIEKAVRDAIEFVDKILSPIVNFKGNTRLSSKKFHSKYQILSMISTTFKEMYKKGEYQHYKDTWEKRKKIIGKNLIQYYVYDIITNYWSEGGTHKIHSVAKPNRYANRIAFRSWEIALDAFYERSMQRCEKHKIATPRAEELVILNSIYLQYFTAQDQLSNISFDIEHIAPKEQMKELIGICKGDGLSISCISNLCYLPESVNRCKKAKNFYQDKTYLSYIELDEIEKKYSFTCKEDLEWMNKSYTGVEDFFVLKENYEEFCKKRFLKIKQKFYEGFGIEREDNLDTKEDSLDIKVESNVKINHKNNSLEYTCKHNVEAPQAPISYLEDMLNIHLEKKSKTFFEDSKNNTVYIVLKSKEYRKKNRERYWFSLTASALSTITQYSNSYLVLVCKDEKTIVVIDIKEVKDYLQFLQASNDQQGKVKHWHIYIYKDRAGKITLELPIPHTREIDITDKLIR